MDSVGIEGIAVCRKGKDFSIADVEDCGAEKERLERLRNMCVMISLKRKSAVIPFFSFRNFLLNSQIFLARRFCMNSTDF